MFGAWHKGIRWLASKAIRYTYMVDRHPGCRGRASRLSSLHRHAGVIIIPGRAGMIWSNLVAGKDGAGAVGASRPEAGGSFKYSCYPIGCTRLSRHHRSEGCLRARRVRGSVCTWMKDHASRDVGKQAALHQLLRTGTQGLFLHSWR